MDRKERTVRTAALHNLGCKVNAYETEVMQQILEQNGYTIVPFSEKADIYVINTCSVTNMADRKSRQMLHRARKQNPDAIVAAVGCYVQTAHDKTHLDVDADIILGNNHKSELIEAIRSLEKERQLSHETGGGQIARLDDLGHQSCYEAMDLERTREHTRAFVKVQDGCNQFCSYCIIPYARGRIRSREPEKAVKEIEVLAENGIREVVLTGIHLSSYGRDLQIGDDALLRLIRRAASVPGIERIRLGSLEPGIMTDSFVSGLAEIPEVCPHFHLSLQSGSDPVLRRMNRHYTAGEFAEKCDLIRRIFGNPALTTDVIVGFPGETEQEFSQTVSFLEQISFYETHIFKFSPREGTRAAAMSAQVSEQVKTARSAALIELGKRNKRKYLRQWDGREAQVLTEEEAAVNGGKLMTGYTREYIRCAVVSEETAGTGSRITGRLAEGQIMKGILRLPDQPQDIDWMYFVPTRD